MFLATACMMKSDASDASHGIWLWPRMLRKQCLNTEAEPTMNTTSLTSSETLERKPAKSSPSSSTPSCHRPDAAVSKMEFVAVANDWSRIEGYGRISGKMNQMINRLLQVGKNDWRSRVPSDSGDIGRRWVARCRSWTSQCGCRRRCGTVPRSACTRSRMSLRPPIELNIWIDFKILIPLCIERKIKITV